MWSRSSKQPVNSLGKLAGLFAIAAVLLLTNLGSDRLWQDEAETAVLSKSTLLYGYPKADDGVNRLNPNPIVPLGPGNSWLYHPWLSFYTGALSFALFGVGTAAARLPFALMGLASIGMAYRTVRQLTLSVPLARWTAALLTLCVPFLLHMRQCRYYAPSVLFSLWAVSAYWRLRQQGKWAVAELAFALVMLFHFNHGVFMPVLGVLALHGFFLAPERRQLRVPLLKTAALVFPLTFPFLLILQPGQHRHPFAWKEISHHIQFYFRQINHYLFPVTLWLVLLPLWRPNRERIFGPKADPAREAYRFAALFLAVNILFLIFVPYQRHFRYLVPMIPFILLFQALFLRDLIRVRRSMGIAALLVMTFTDLHYVAPYFFSDEPQKPRVLLAEFAGELTRTYRGPVDGIIELLEKEGKPGETVKIPYDDHAVLFYTKLNVEPIPRPADFLKPTTPEWIIPRRDWTPQEFFESDYYRRIQETYREIVLDAPDIPWQNRPDPGYHRFRTDSEAPPVRVFRRIDP